MFFVGFSCSILPYILAMLFAWVFVGNTSAKNTKTNESEKAKVIEYKASKTKVAKVYHYHKFFDGVLASAQAPRHFVILNCWRKFCVDIPLTDIFLINPIKRGPPQYL